MFDDENWTPISPIFRKGDLVAHKIHTKFLLHNETSYGYVLQVQENVLIIGPTINTKINDGISVGKRHYEHFGMSDINNSSPIETT